MSWYQKEAHTPFDSTPIDGLFFLIGDLIANKVGREWTTGMKYPMVEFPSQTAFELWQGGKTGIIHLFGEMDLPLSSTRDEGFAAARQIAEQVGYLALVRGDTQLELIGHDEGEHLLLTYDNLQRTIIDIAPVVSKSHKRLTPQPELLDTASRERLPPLYSNEAL